MSNEEFAFTIRCKSEAGSNILLRQRWERGGRSLDGCALSVLEYRICIRTLLCLPMAGRGAALPATRFPLFRTDSSLCQNTLQQCPIQVAAMRVRHNKTTARLAHERVRPATLRSAPAKDSQTADKLASLDRLRHRPARADSDRCHRALGVDRHGAGHPQSNSQAPLEVPRGKPPAFQPLPTRLRTGR